VKYLEPDDLSRSGTARGCKLGRPAGSGASWTFTVSGCSTGTLDVSLRAGAVIDTVSNWGPAQKATAPTVLFDRSVPSAAPPKLVLRSGAPLASIAPTTGVLGLLTLSAKDTGGAGVASYDVRRSRDGAGFTDLAIGHSAATLAVSLAPGHAYRFAIRARDRAGNVGAWIAGPTVGAALVQQSSTAIAYAGTWNVGESDDYSASFDRFSFDAGAAAKYTFTARGIGFVATRGPDRGAVRVYLDGDLVATVDTHASSLEFRYVAWSRTWASAGTHTLKLVVVGSAGRPRVDLDALEVLR
jgi:hypothetical protein